MGDPFITLQALVSIPVYYILEIHVIIYVPPDLSFREQGQKYPRKD